MILYSFGSNPLEVEPVVSTIGFFGGLVIFSFATGKAWAALRLIPDKVGLLMERVSEMLIRKERRREEDDGVERITEGMFRTILDESEREDSDWEGRLVEEYGMEDD